MADTTRMADPTTTPLRHADQQDRGAPSRLRRGRWCVVAALVGVVQGVVLLAWPHQVATDRFSFPQTAGWYVIAQATFFLQHLPLAAAVAAVAAMPAIRREKLAYRFLVAAAVGLGLLALLELVAMSAATAAEDSSLGTAVNNLYSIPVLLTGVGLLVGGIVLLRRRTAGRRLPWTLCALGFFVFVGLVPALSSDSFVVGRLAIMAWMLLSLLLGRVLQRQASPAAARISGSGSTLPCGVSHSE